MFYLILGLILVLVVAVFYWRKGARKIVVAILVVSTVALGAYIYQISLALTVTSQEQSIEYIPR